jgi:anaerobic selenocysteine-containing dehydrogenase
MQRVKGGANAVRAVACLPALTGAWRDRAGGLLLSNSSNFKVNKQDLHRPDLLGARRPRILNMSTIGNDLNNPGSSSWGPQVKAVLVYNSNPLAVAPQSGMVAKGFAREDLFTVVMEHFQTDTADYADYILPATTQLEHWDVQGSYGHTDVLLNRPAIEPVGQAKSNSEIFRLLAKAMGYTEDCFAESDFSMCRTAVGPDVNFQTLLDVGFVSMPVPDAPFAQGGFATPSGRCEFVSGRLAAQGLDPLPDHVPNYEVPVVGSTYPLAMISPPARNFLNSSFVNVESLRDIEKEPLLEICMDDASARGIATGDTVKVFNDRGEYHCKADVSSRARPGVVNGLGIWWRKMGLNGTNVNEVTSQLLTDLGRAPVFYDCQVEVALLKKA